MTLDSGSLGCRLAELGPAGHGGTGGSHCCRAPSGPEATTGQMQKGPPVMLTLSPSPPSTIRTPTRHWMGAHQVM